MEGALEGDRRGIIPRAIQDIFHTIQTDTAPNSKYLVRASYLQIYNEVSRAPPLSLIPCVVAFMAGRALLYLAGP